MKIIEYGINHPDTLILLHGGGLSWWNYREEALLLQDSFHIVIPILDGHAGSDREFTTIQDNAEELIQVIDSSFNGSVQMIAGLSLGAQILTEVLSRRKDICRHALIESACVIPSPTESRLIPASVRASYGLIQKDWFSKLQFSSLKIQDSLYEDYRRDSRGISLNSLIRILQASTDYSLPDAFADTQADLILVAGEKENSRMHQSVNCMHEAVLNSQVMILKGYTHGSFSLNHPDEYAQLIRKWLRVS